MTSMPLRCGCSLQINEDTMDGSAFTQLCIDHYKKAHGATGDNDGEIADSMERINKELGNG